MSKAPAIQLYVSDFLTGTRFLSNAQTGLYIRLLLEQADKGFVGQEVIENLHVYGKDSQGIWPTIASKFTEKEAGKFFNERMEKVLAEREAFRLKQSEKGKLSAEARLNRGKTKKKHRFNRGSTVVEPLEGEDRDRVLTQEGKERASDSIEPVVAKVEDIRFEALWANYGRIGSKPEALGYWKVLSEPDRMAIESKLPAYVASTPGGAYRKHLQGWINPKYRRWESAIVTSNPTNGQSSEQQRAANYERILAERYPNG
jgi:uncharacterized protein YdaU (DUF1376 family)